MTGNRKVLAGLESFDPGPGEVIQLSPRRFFHRPSRQDVEMESNSPESTSMNDLTDEVEVESEGEDDYD